MHRVTRVGLSALLVAATGLVLFSGPVVAELKIVIVSKEKGVNQRAEISGTKGETILVNVGKNVDLPNERFFYGITGILIEEAGDRPCHVKIFGGALDSDKGPDDRKLGQATIGNCNRLPPIGALIVSISDSTNRFVDGIKVCDSKNNRNERIKGLSIRPAHVKSDATVTREAPPTSAQDESPNCGAFDSLQYCDDGMIASGVVMHHDGDSFTGIQLACRDLQVLIRPLPLKKDDIGY